MGPVSNDHTRLYARVRDPDHGAWSAADHADVGRQLIDI